MSGGRLKRGRERGLSKFAWAPCFATAWALMAAGFLGDPAGAAQIAPNPNFGVISAESPTNSESFLNHGDVTVTGSLLNWGTFTNHGQADIEYLSNTAAGTVVNRGSLSTSGSGFNQGSMSNHSLWTLNGSFSNRGTLENFGDIQTVGGSLDQTGGDLKFWEGSTFTGSLWHYGGTARIAGSAQFDTYHGDGLLEVESNGIVTNTGQGTYNMLVDGSFTNLAGGWIHVARSPANSIDVGSGGSLYNQGFLGGGLVANAGLLTQATTGTLEVDQLTNLAGGVLSVEGNWDVEHFVNHGTARLPHSTGSGRTIENQGLIYVDSLLATPHDFQQGPNGTVVVGQSFDWYSDGPELEGTVRGLPGAVSHLADAIIGPTGRLEFEFASAVGSLLNRGELVVEALTIDRSFENEGFFSGSLNPRSNGLVNRGHAVVHNRTGHFNDPTIINEASGLLETFNLAVAVVQNEGHWITRGTVAGNHGGSTAATGRSVGVLEHAEGELNLFNFHLDGTLKVRPNARFDIWSSTFGPALTIENSGHLNLNVDPGSGRPALLRQLAGNAALDPRSAPLAIKIHGGQAGFWGDFTQAADESLSIVLRPNEPNSQGLIRASQQLSFLGRLEFVVDQPDQLAQGMEFLVGKARGIDLSQATIVLPDLSAWLLRLVVDVVNLPSNSPFQDLDGLRVRVLAIPEPRTGVLLLLAVGVFRRRRVGR